MAYKFPKIYPILDASVIPAGERVAFLERLGASLADAGVALLEYRNKMGPDYELEADAAVLRRTMPSTRLILDDRADLVEQFGFDGVHVDDGDLTPAAARALLGPDRIIGTLGGGREFLPDTLTGPADYLSVGIVFPTRTKQTASVPIGIEGVRRMRELAGPERVLVAIGGLTLERAELALEAGASVVAVAGAFFRQPDPAAEYRRWTERLR